MGLGAEHAGSLTKDGHSALSEDDGKSWGDLPPELMEAIGAGLGADSVHASNASLVCKGWRAARGGMMTMTMDMHPDPARWGKRLAGVSAAVRGLKRASIYIPPSIPSALLAANIDTMRAQIHCLEALHIQLPDSYLLGPDAARALGALVHLTELSLVGGALGPGAAIQLLVGLAQSRCLRRLRVLPLAAGGVGRSGLGDEEVAVVAACSQLQELEFRAHRLTSAGLASLVALKHVQRLAVSSLESDTSYELSALARLASLQHLDLALDHGGAGGAPGSGPMGPLKPLADTGSSAALALHFRWTDRAAGLLRSCQAQLLRSLTALDLGVCRVSSGEVFAALAELTSLTRMGMSVYSNSDTQVLCELSQFSRLASLQSLAFTKQQAYFPEQRRFRASSIAVPVTHESVAVLAGQWASSLRELHLGLSRSDFTPDGLRALAGFTALHALAIIVEAGGSGSSSNGSSSSALLGSGVLSSSPPSGSGLLGPAASKSWGVGGRLSAPADVAVVDVGCMPRGLQRLTLSGVHVEVPQWWARGAGHSSVAPLVPAAQLSPLMDSQPTWGLQELSLEGCSVQRAQLGALAAAVSGSLRSLSLVGLMGMSNEGLGGLACLRHLTSLVIFAPGNPAVTQSGLLHLSCLRGLKYLSYESDDLTNMGPVLEAYAPFTGLRMLSLSCNRQTLRTTLPGGMRALAAMMPYCYVDVVGGGAYAGVEEEEEEQVQGGRRDGS